MNPAITVFILFLASLVLGAEHVAVDLEKPDSFTGFITRLWKADFMPHGHCFFWRSDILWLHVLSDVLIGIAYFSIPLMLLYFRKKRKDLPYPWMFGLFAAFIFWCGTTHFMNIVTLWIPIYRAEGIVKLITAGISVWTAILLFPLIPQALSLRSQKEFEAEQNRRRQLEHFAHIASHDLKEPLRTISLFSELLSKKEMDVESQEYFAHINRSSQRLAELIEDLSSYSRLDVDGLHKERVNLRDCFQEAFESLTVALEEAKVEVQVSLPSSKFEVLAVKSQIVQLFQNLISNAIKFRKQNAPLQLRVEGTLDNKTALVSISDNGIGFDPQFAEQIFVVFKRLHTVEAGYQGTGMGLAICKKVIERHGGEIWAKSSPDQGSTFLFRLPLA